MRPENNTNPFVGLRPFESDESLLFFGRQEQTMELLQRLHQHHFVAVIGNSGCGKSSLIRGGLIPRLKAGYLVDDRDRWMITMMKPGQSPLHNLADVVLKQLNIGNGDQSVTGLVKKIREEGADAILHILKPLWEKQDTNFFLLVDQFEELFRFSMDQKEIQKKDEAIDFVNIMLALSRQTDLPVYVVMTMRSDFIGDCAQFFGLPEAMNQSQYLVPRLNRVQLKNVIEGPVKLYGGSISPALTSKLLNDLIILKDELPLLEHALMRIWDYEINVDKNGELDLKDYENIGGIEKALSDHADEALEGMSAGELALTKQIFQALIITDEGGRKIRRPVLMSELQAITGKDRAQLMNIINKFSEEKRSFLIVSKTSHSNEELIDISHESLIRQWGALSGWADEESESSKIYLQLNESANLYGHKKKDLLKGREFQIAMQWYETVNPSSAWAKRYNDGFDESISYLLKSSKEVKLSERRKRNRLILTFSAIIVSLCAVFLIIKTKTEKERQKAINLKDAFSLNSRANNKEFEDPTIAIRLAEAGFHKEQDSSFTETMQKIYGKNAFYKILVTDSFGIPSLSVSGDGTKFVTGSYGKIARLWSIDGQLLTEFKGHRDSVCTVAFSPDGKMVLTSSRDETARLWDLKGNLLREFKGDGGRLFTAAFSPDGTKVMTGSLDGLARLWSIDGNLIRSFKNHRDNIRCIAFSPDGSKFVTGSQDETAVLCNIDGKILHVYEAHKNCVAAVAFSPDGTKILTGSFDETVKLWDLQGNKLQEFIGHNWPIYSVAFSQDGKKILTGASDGTARFWDMNGNVMQVFKGHSDPIRAAVFLPDETRVMTAGSDRTVRIWYRVNNLFREYKDYTDSVNTVIFSPDGKKIFIGSSDKQARLCNLNGSLIHAFTLHAGRINAATFSPDGTGILMATGNILELRSLDDKLIRQFTGHTGKITSIALSPDGNKIVTGSADSTAKLWSMEGHLLKEFKVNEKVLFVGYSQDGTKVLTASDHIQIGVWKPDGNLIKKVALKGKDSSVTSSSVAIRPDSLCIAFSTDGTKVLLSNRDKTVWLWGLDGDGILLASFKGHANAVLAASFSPDGTRVLTGSEDYSVRLWSINGSSLMEFKGHNECVVAVTFSRDGTKILTGSEDHTARLWNNLSLEEFLKSGLVESLTEEQKKEFGIIK